MRLLSVEACQLVLIDLQMRLVPAMAEAQRLVKSCEVLVEIAREVGIPMTVSEQYPQGLGSTVAAIASKLVHQEAIAKVEFSIFRQARLQEAIAGYRRPQLVVAGVEAHVCVLQSVMDALDRGMQVFVVTDAVASRSLDSKLIALERMREAGAVLVTSEMVLFECLGSASSPHFRYLSRLVR